MPTITHNKSLKEKRAQRVRRYMHGTAERPRLTVSRSNKHLVLQAINDDTHVVIAAVSDLGKAGMKGTKTERAALLGKQIAEQLKKTKVSKLMFDRGSYQYHGRVAAVADALRKEGIEV